MAIERINFAAATCSWIDAATGLPEIDNKSINSPSLPRDFFVGNDGYRFCNFLEIWANIDRVAKIVRDGGFTDSSKIYRGPSYAHVPSHAFLIQQEVFAASGGGMRFTQVVGARTVSPEVGGAGTGAIVGLIGGVGVRMLAGAAIGSVIPFFGTALGAGVMFVAGTASGFALGEITGHRLLGFPPIWTKIQITLDGDGAVRAEVLQHSLFPSMTAYQQTAVSPDGRPERSLVLMRGRQGAAIYDATKDTQLPDWKARGWGQLKQSSDTGPTPGNPWGINKGVMGLRSSNPN